MKKILLIVVCCMYLCGCGNKEETILKSEYDELNAKYNELINSSNTSKETEYLKNYIDKFNIQVSQMGNRKILEIFVDSSKAMDATKIIDMIYEDWFQKYDYVFFIGYGYNQIVGLSQIDGKTGKIISALTLNDEH